MWEMSLWGEGVAENGSPEATYDGAVCAVH
jgi:hypothetical protein